MSGGKASCSKDIVHVLGIYGIFEKVCICMCLHSTMNALVFMAEYVFFSTKNMNFLQVTISSLTVITE